jgi:acyl-CoA synthetase (AMP-forming)/AMP-acid ligase II
VGRAFVVLKPGMAATADELLAHMAAHLARYKAPRSVEFRSELPLSGMGKILRRELR